MESIKIKNLDEAQLVADLTASELVAQALHALGCAEEAYKVDVSQILDLHEKRYFFLAKNPYDLSREKTEDVIEIEFLEKDKYKIKIKLNSINTKGFYSYKNKTGTASIILTLENDKPDSPKSHIHFDSDDKKELIRTVNIIEKYRNEVFSKTSESEYLKLIYNEKFDLAFELFIENSLAVSFYHLLELLEFQNLISFQDIINWSYEEISETIVKITDNGYAKMQEKTEDRLEIEKTLFTASLDKYYFNKTRRT